jgi:hypothetical protein
MASGVGVDGAVYYTHGTHSTVKSRHSLRKATIAVRSTGKQEPRSNPPEKGDVFVSDVLYPTTNFLALYEQDRVTEDQIDDFIARWHESDADEQRSLAEFLGMTDTEYSVCLMAPDTLPLIRQARQEHVPLRSLLVPYLAALRASANPADGPVIHALGHWLSKP